MTIKIEQKFVVAGEIFDSVEAAEKFLAEQADQIRVEAFFDWYRDARGAQRISQSQRDLITDFINFEKGEAEESSDLDEAVEIVAEGLAEGETLAAEPESAPFPVDEAEEDAEEETPQERVAAGKSLFSV